MTRLLRTVCLALCLSALFVLGGCFHQHHHQHGACGQPCGMKREQCATCAQKCQMQCPNCPCKTAPAADAATAK